MTALAIFVGAIIALGVLFMIAVHIYAYATIWISTRKLSAQLYQRQRTMFLEEAKKRIARKEGMILVDAPTIGWNVVRVWWSPSTDFIPRSELEEKEDPASKGDIENHRRYIDLATGSACLVDGFVFSQRAKKYLLKHFGREDAPFILTGTVLFDQVLKERKDA